MGYFIERLLFDHSNSGQRSSKVLFGTFKAELTNLNFEIDRIAEETGLNLMPYIINMDEFGEVDNYLVLEDWEARQKGYTFYKYDNLNLSASIEHLDNLRERLLRASIERRQYIDQLEALWRRNPQLEEMEVKVHFGLYYLTSSVPLRVLAKHQIYFRKDTFMNYYLHFDQTKEVLRFQIEYKHYAEEHFDNYLTYLAWGLTPASRNVSPGENAHRNLRALCAQIAKWEQYTFSGLRSSS